MLDNRFYCEESRSWEGRELNEENDFGVVCVACKRGTAYFVRAILRRGVVSMSVPVEEGAVYLMGEGIGAVEKAEEVEGALREMNGVKKRSGGEDRFSFLARNFDKFPPGFFGAKGLPELLEVLAR